MSLMRSCSVMRSLSGGKIGYVEESSSWDPDDEVRLEYKQRNRFSDSTRRRRREQDQMRGKE